MILAVIILMVAVAVVIILCIFIAVIFNILLDIYEDDDDCDIKEKYVFNNILSFSNVLTVIYVCEAFARIIDVMDWLEEKLNAVGKQIEKIDKRLAAKSEAFYRSTLT